MVFLSSPLSMCVFFQSFCSFQPVSSMFFLFNPISMVFLFNLTSIFFLSNPVSGFFLCPILSSFFFFQSYQYVFTRSNLIIKKNSPFQSYKYVFFFPGLSVCFFPFSFQSYQLFFLSNSISMIFFFTVLSVCCFAQGPLLTLIGHFLCSCSTSQAMYATPPQWRKRCPSH